MSRVIINSEDIIDSRDVIARIDELESELEEGSIDAETDCFMVGDDDMSEEYEELMALNSLADQCRGYAGDWEHGEALIRDSYFQEYAEQLADDIGAIDSSVSWPLNCIDWEQAADELKMDYTSVDFEGVEYWIR